jgi:hypothetical protein
MPGFKAKDVTPVRYCKKGRAGEIYNISGMGEEKYRSCRADLQYFS